MNSHPRHFFLSRHFCLITPLSHQFVFFSALPPAFKLHLCSAFWGIFRSSSEVFFPVAKEITAKCGNVCLDESFQNTCFSLPVQTMCYIRRSALIISLSLRTRYIKTAGNQGNYNNTETALARPHDHVVVLFMHSQTTEGSLGTCMVSMGAV